MKAKVILGLAALILVGSVVGGLLTESVEAQLAKNPLAAYSGWPVNVTFDEDPMRQHALQIVSYSLLVPANFSPPPVATTVPSGKRLVITDIITGSDTRNTDYIISLRTVVGGGTRFSHSGPRFHLPLASGIVFNAGESVFVNLGATWDDIVTISGYLVDL